MLGQQRRALAAAAWFLSKLALVSWPDVIVG